VPGLGRLIIQLVVKQIKAPSFGKKGA